MQKRIKRRSVCFLVTLITLLLLASIAVFADTPSVIQAGTSYELHPDAPENQYEISGITGNFKSDDLLIKLDWGNIGTFLEPEYMQGCYVAKAPVVVRSLDDGYLFGVYQLEYYNDKDFSYYGFSWGSSELPFSKGSPSTDGTIPAGCEITITEPGDYLVYFRYDSYVDMGLTSTFIRIEAGTSTSAPSPAPSPKPTPVAQSYTANPTKSTVLINGEQQSFEAYNIDGFNYFKLRDLAFVLSGTEKQFDVGWNSEKRVISLTSGKPYTVADGELAAGDGLAKKAVQNTASIYKDGESIELIAYNISGNNYFKLRDLGKTFDFDIGWDATTSTITVDTKASYTE